MGATDGGAFALINFHYSRMLPAEKRIADVLLSHSADISTVSIGELAELSGASKATVTRFCKRLGFEGFRDFRVSAIIDTHKGLSPGKKLAPDASVPLEALVHTVCDSNAGACKDTKLLLSAEALGKAAALIAEAPKVLLLAEGPTAPVALDFYQKLLRLGIEPVHTSDRRIRRMHVSITKPGDVVVAFDLAGQSRATVEMTEAAAKNGAETIAVCNAIGSPLAKAAGISLYGPGRTGSDISGTLAPRIALMCIVDCLFYAVHKQRGGESEESILKTNQVILDDWM